MLTGLQAGLLIALDEAPITIGRATDADLVIEDPSIGAHHTRVARMAGGQFFIVDLASENGTFVDADRVGVALLRDGDTLRLGPTAQIRFAIVHSAGDQGLTVGVARTVQ